jgi:hypothetical protein
LQSIDSRHGTVSKASTADRAGAAINVEMRKEAASGVATAAQGRSRELCLERLAIRRIRFADRVKDGAFKRGEAHPY